VGVSEYDAHHPSSIRRSWCRDVARGVWAVGTAGTDGDHGTRRGSQTDHSPRGCAYDCLSARRRG